MASRPRKYWDWGDDDREFKFNSYLGRYHTRHLDLMDVLSMYQPRATAGLDAMARLCGFPGKLGMDGSEVHAAIVAGKLDDVRRYCETDVMNTYLVFLRFRLMRGELSAGEHAQEVSLARERIAAIGAPHWLEFIAAWDANAWHEPAGPPQGRIPERGARRCSVTRRAAPGRIPEREARRYSSKPNAGGCASAASGSQERHRSVAAAEHRLGGSAPPALEHGRVDRAKVERVTDVAVASQAIERRRFAVESAGHAPAQRKVDAGGSVVRAAGQVLARAATEFRVGQDQRLVPPIRARPTRRLSDGDAPRQLTEEPRLRRASGRCACRSPSRLRRDDGHAGRIGDDLACGVDGVAESARRKLGREDAVACRDAPPPARCRPRPRRMCR